MAFSDDRSQTKERILVTERLCRPAHVFQTATEPSTSGSTAITMASDWSTLSYHSVVHVKNTIIAIINKAT